jgi:hypothetical protein
MLTIRLRERTHAQTTQIPAGLLNNDVSVGARIAKVVDGRTQDSIV